MLKTRHIWTRLLLEPEYVRQQELNIDKAVQNFVK